MAKAKKPKIDKEKGQPFKAGDMVFIGGRDVSGVVIDRCVMDAENPKELYDVGDGGPDYGHPMVKVCVVWSENPTFKEREHFWLSSKLVREIDQETLSAMWSAKDLDLGDGDE